MLAIGNFHYIRENFESTYPSIFGLTPRQFEDQLKILSKHGKFISSEDLLHPKKYSFTDKLLLITFDDGLKEQYELAKPILDKMGIPFVCFVNTVNFEEKKVSLVHKIHLLRSCISPKELENIIKNELSISLTGKEINKAHIHYNYDVPGVARLKYLLNFKLGVKDLKELVAPLFSKYFDEKKIAENLYMTETQLKALWGSGSLGSHAHTHDPLGLLSKEEVKENLDKTQNFFESRYGEKSRYFSYPYGSYEASKNLSLALKDSGFKMAFTMERAINKDLKSDPYLMARYDCNDLPGGKADIFKGRDIFENPVFAKWNTYENSSFNK